MTRSDIDLLCLGEPLIEFNETEAGLYKRGFGGDVSNVAIRARRQGARSGMICAIGTDSFGGALMRLWEAEEVSTDLVRHDDTSPTGIYFVSHGPDGHAFEYRRAGSAMSRTQAFPDAEPALKSCRILHLSGISLAISPEARQAARLAVGTAKAGGALISFDTNYRPALWSPEAARRAIEELLPEVDILLPSLEDAQLLTGLNDPFEVVAHFESTGPRIIALTRGADGAIVTDVANGVHAVVVPPTSVTPVDATGAGDAFDGAFLAGLLEGLSVVEAAQVANTVAAKTTQGYGALA